jgi:ABC-2 type transport system permease protein
MYLFIALKREDNNMAIMQSFQRIYAILLKEFLQLSRDRITFGMVVMIPLIQLLLFGYAINTDVRHLPVALVDYSNSSISRNMVAVIEASQIAKITRRETTIQQAEAALNNGLVKAIVVIPKDVEKRLQDGMVASQVIIDGSDTMTSSLIARIGSIPRQIIQGYSNVAGNKLFEVSFFYNPEKRTAVNIIPALAGIILTMTLIMFTAIALVREREHGNMELLITTPVLSIEIMIGKIIPYIIAGLVQVTIILTLGYFIFDVPINGSVVQIFFATLLFIAASLTLGLIISTAAVTQMQAMQMTVFVLLPSILLSGFMFPFEGMPKPFQWLAEVLPATHYMRLMRGIVLRGSEVAYMLKDAISLLLFSILGMLLAAYRFKKTLD